MSINYKWLIPLGFVAGLTAACGKGPTGPPPIEEHTIVVPYRTQEQLKGIQKRLQIGRLFQIPEYCARLGVRGDYLAGLIRPGDDPRAVYADKTSDGQNRVVVTDPDTCLDALGEREYIVKPRPPTGKGEITANKVIDPPGYVK